MKPNCHNFQKLAISIAAALLVAANLLSAQEIRRTHSTGLYGIMDSRDKWILKPKFREIREASEGRFAVQDISGRWGYADGDGNIVIKCRYGYCGQFSEGLAAVKTRKGWGFIDKSGQMCIRPIRNVTVRHGFSEGLCAVESAYSGYGYIDRYGELIIGPQYTCCISFSEGLAAVCLNGKWGYVDRAGKVKIPFDFVSAESFADGIAVAKLSGGPNRTIWLTEDGKRHETEQDAVTHRKAIMEEYLEMQKEPYSEYRERKIKEMLKTSVSFREKTLQKKLKREFIKEKTKYKPDYKLGAYDPKNKEYIIFYDKTVIPLHVPPRAAENFREQWDNIRKDTGWSIDNDRLTIDRIRFTLPDGTTYTYRKIN